MNGICDATRACSNVFGSMIDAHEINRFDSCRGPRFVSITAPIILAKLEPRAWFSCFDSRPRPGTEDVHAARIYVLTAHLRSAGRADRGRRGIERSVMPGRPLAALRHRAR